MSSEGSLLFVAGAGISQLKWHWYSQRRPLNDLSTYDEASRGPWGSTKLLWTARWRHLAAFLGALITVVALGVDPFTQAVVSYYPCSTAASRATSNISRLNSFFTRGTGYGMPTSVRIAIDASFGDSTAFMTNHTCSTNSCTFSQQYHSIGLCSKCSDVTNQLHISCKPGIGKGCNYTLSTPYPDLVINTTASYLRAPVVRRAGTNGDVSYANWQVLAVKKFADVRDPSGVMVPAGSIGTTSHISSTIDLVSASPMLGCRCSVFYCVRTYTATIESGVLKESLQSKSSNWSSYTPEAAVLGTVKTDCLAPKVQSHLLSNGYISTNTEWMRWNGTYLNGTESQNQISDSTNLTIPADCVYQAQLLDEALEPDPKEFFSDPLTGVLNGSGWGTNIQTDPESSSILLELWNNGTISLDSINEALENFTTVASNFLRTLNSPIPKHLQDYQPSNMNYQIPDNPVQGVPSDWNQPAVGEAFTTTTCIHVRWAWLALPAALVVAMLIFIVSAIIQTACDGGHEVWKASQNALLWHGLDGPAENDSTTLITTNEMHARAKELTVQLRKTGRGWKLTQDD